MTQRDLNQYHRIQRLALLNPEYRIITISSTTKPSDCEPHVHFKMNSDCAITSETLHALRKAIGVQDHISYVFFDYFAQQPGALAASVMPFVQNTLVPIFSAGLLAHGCVIISPNVKPISDVITRVFESTIDSPLSTDSGVSAIFTTTDILSQQYPLFIATASMSTKSDSFRVGSNIKQISRLHPTHPFSQHRLEYLAISPESLKPHVTTDDHIEEMRPMRAYSSENNAAMPEMIPVAATTEPLSPASRKLHDAAMISHLTGNYPSVTQPPVVLEYVNDPPNVQLHTISAPIKTNYLIAELAGNLLSREQGVKAQEETPNSLGLLWIEFKQHSLCVDLRTALEMPPAIESAPSVALTADIAQTGYCLGRLISFGSPGNCQILERDAISPQILTTSFDAKNPIRPRKRDSFPVDRTMHYPRIVLLASKCIQPGEVLRISLTEREKLHSVFKQPAVPQPTIADSQLPTDVHPHVSRLDETEINLDDVVAPPVDRRLIDGDVMLNKPTYTGVASRS